MNEIKIYGQIGLVVNPEHLADQLKDFDGDLTVRINSPGGDVFAGYAIYNMIQDYKGNVIVHIDGVAASMASVIALAGDKVIMAKNALYMIHNPSSGTQGDSAEHIKKAELLDTVKSILIDAYNTKTGISKKKLSKMLDNETWLKSDKALKLGFVDEIKSSVLKKDIENVMSLQDPNTIYAHYVINNKEDMNKETLKLLGLPEDATNEAVNAAIRKLLKPKKTVSEKKKKKIKAVIDNAIREHKFNATMSAKYEQLMALDFKGTKAIIEDMNAPVKLSERISGHKLNNQKPLLKKDDRKNWGLQEYRKYDPQLLKRDRALYNELVEKEFPTE